MAQGNVADDKIFKFTLLMRRQQQNIQTGWHLRYVGLDAAVNAKSAHDVSYDWWDTNAQNVFPADCSILRTEAIEITSKEYFGQDRVGVAGTNTGNNVVNGLAAMIALRSNQRARERNGRMFWPTNFLPVADVFGAGDLGALTTAAASFQTTFTGAAPLGGFRAVVVSPARLANPQATPPVPARIGTWIDVETVKVSQFASYLRSRKPGVGG